MSEKNIIEQKKQLNKLISEMSNNRINIRDILDKTVSYRNSIEKLKPSTKDYRLKVSSKASLATEMIDSAMNVIKTELLIRKHLDDSIKTESELRRKLLDILNLDLDNQKNADINISDVANMLEQYQKEKNKKELLYNLEKE